MKPSTEARLGCIERLILNLFPTIPLLEKIMANLQELQDKIDALTAGQTEAQADAARHEARTNEAVGLLQALKAIIDSLPNTPALITQAQLDALNAQAAAALADMDAANTQRDAADDALAAGVAANTPPATP